MALHAAARQPVDWKLATNFCANVVGRSRLVGEDKARTLDAPKRIAELINPTIAAHCSRIIGTLGEFASVVDAVPCAAAVQRPMIEFGQRIHERDHV